MRALLPADSRAVRRVALALMAGVLALSPLRGATANVPGASCPLFPADSVWHADVSGLPVHPRSGAWLASMGGAERRLHPDFGPAGDGEQPYGIPFAIVDSSTPKVAVSFEYADESDAGPYPFGPSTPVETGSDRHALMVDRDACVLYELYAVDWNGGAPTAGSGAIWDLRSNALRPDTWTSADAAGLSILAGLLRRDEVASGVIDHAIRLTASQTDRSYVWPARHQAGAANDVNLPPMGARFRLRGDVNLGGFRADTQVVLRAMQRYGLIIADNGSNWYLTGTSEPGWDNALLDELKSVPAGWFEAVDASSLVVDPNSGQSRVGASPSPSPSPAPAPAPAPTAATTATTAATTTVTTLVPTTLPFEQAIPPRVTPRTVPRQEPEGDATVEIASAPDEEEDEVAIVLALLGAIAGVTVVMGVVLHHRARPRKATLQAR